MLPSSRFVFGAGGVNAPRCKIAGLTVDGGDLCFGYREGSGHHRATRAAGVAGSSVFARRRAVSRAKTGISQRDTCTYLSRPVDARCR